MKRMNLGLLLTGLLLLQHASVFAAAQPAAGEAAQQVLPQIANEISQSFFSAYKHHIGYPVFILGALAVGAGIDYLWNDRQTRIIEASAEADIKRKAAETENKILEENNRYAAHERAEKNRLHSEEIIRSATVFVQQFDSNNDDAAFSQQIIMSNEALNPVTSFYHISKSHIQALASIKNGEYESVCAQLQERLEAHQKRARSIPTLRIEQDKELEQEEIRKGRDLDNLVKERTAETLKQYTQATKRTAQFVEDSTSKIQTLMQEVYKSSEQNNKQLREINGWHKTSVAQLNRYLPSLVTLLDYIQNLANKDDMMQLANAITIVTSLVTRIEKTTATKDDIGSLHKKLDACPNNEQLRAAMEQVTKPLASIHNLLNNLPNKSDHNALAKRFETLANTVIAKSSPQATNHGWNASKITPSAPPAGPEHEEE